MPLNRTVRKHQIIKLGGLLAGALFLACGSSHAAEDGLLLKQKSSMMGRTETLYSKEGVKLFLYDKKQYLLMRPPLWRVQICNLEGKTYWEGEAKTFKANFTSTCSMFRPGDPSGMKATSSEAADLKGLAVKKFKLTGQKVPGATANLKTWERLLVREGYLWMLPTSEVPAEISKILNKAFAAPMAPGIPLEMKVTNNGGTINQEFTLLSVEHKPCSAADFKVPANFKRLAKQEQMIDSHGVGDAFAEMF